MRNDGFSTGKDGCEAIILLLPSQMLLQAAYTKDCMECEDAGDEDGSFVVSLFDKKGKLRSTVSDCLSVAQVSKFYKALLSFDPLNTRRHTKGRVIGERYQRSSSSDCAA